MYRGLWLNCQVSHCTGDSTQKTVFKKPTNPKLMNYMTKYRALTSQWFCFSTAISIDVK